MSNAKPNIASTSGPSSQNVFPHVIQTQWNKDTSESFEGEDTDSDIFESLPASPNAEKSESESWGFQEPDRRLGKDFDPGSSPPSSRSRSPPRPTSFPFGPLDATASPPSSTAEKRGMVPTKPTHPTEAPSCPVRGMYRLLDLITEQGSSGLVDKIVISQESLQAFINALSPGAYSSITRVNFKVLDDLLLKPIGVYGSREEIVRFFREIGAVDVETCVHP